MTQLASNNSNSTTSATMQAAVIDKPQHLTMQEIEPPEADASQVRVRLEGCGVCASNIPPWEGRDWFDYPMAPGALGHEAWGVVDQVGQNVSQIKVGDRVAMMSGQAYAEYDVAKEADVVLLPEGLEGDPFPGEPLGCAMNIFERSDIQQGQTVAILGVGFLGSLLTQLCKDAGAKVIAISRRKSSLKTAQQFGADHTIEWTDSTAVIEQVARLTGGVGGYGEVKGWCDRVIECTGKQDALDLVGEITAVKGTVVIAGFHQDGPRSVDMQLWNWRGLNMVNAHERDPQAYTDGIRKAIKAVEAGRIDHKPLLTHTYRLSQLDQALDAARTRPEGFVKAYVTMPAATGEASS